MQSGTVTSWHRVYGQCRTAFAACAMHVAVASASICLGGPISCIDSAERNGRGPSQHPEQVNVLRAKCSAARCTPAARLVQNDHSVRGIGELFPGAISERGPVLLPRAVGERNLVLLPACPELCHCNRRIPVRIINVCRGLFVCKERRSPLRVCCRQSAIQMMVHRDSTGTRVR